MDNFVGVVLGQDDRVTRDQRFSELLLQFVEIWSRATQHVSPMRRLEFDAEHADVDWADADDSGYMRNKQTRDRRRLGIQFDIDWEVLPAQPVQDACEAGRARICRVETRWTLSLQFDGETLTSTPPD